MAPLRSGLGLHSLAADVGRGATTNGLSTSRPEEPRRCAEAPLICAPLAGEVPLTIDLQKSTIAGRFVQIEKFLRAKFMCFVFNPEFQFWHVTSAKTLTA